VTLEEKIGERLSKGSLTVGLAESCTGGLVAERLTRVPGASDYFEVGVVTYSNRSKTRLIAVPQEVIAENGAVSAIVAEFMARGVREMGAVDIGLSITGIAGPSGGSPEKPVGTVFMGLATEKGVYAKKLSLAGSRQEIRYQASEEALLMLLDYLEGRPL